MPLPARVDTSRWDPDVDRKGEPIAPGDIVSVPRYPRGVVRGVLRLSERQWSVLPNGEEVGALVIEDEDGRRWEVTSKVLKLKRQSLGDAQEQATVRVPASLLAESVDFVNEQGWMELREKGVKILQAADKRFAYVEGPEDLVHEGLEHLSWAAFSARTSDWEGREGSEQRARGKRWTAALQKLAAKMPRHRDALLRWLSD